MSLLADIKKAAVDSSVPIADLLRHCKVLASELEVVEFETWVDSELNGYKKDAELPAYRVVRAASYGQFVGAFGAQINNLPIPTGHLPDYVAEYADRFRLAEPISLVAKLAQTAGRQTIRLAWPAALTNSISDKLLENYTLVNAWHDVGVSTFAAIVDTVRTRVLNFVLKIEREIPPEQRSREDGIATVSSQSAEHHFHTTILGNVAQVAFGHGARQDMSVIHVATGDLAGLKRELQRLGIQDGDVALLDAALLEDQSEAGPVPQTIGAKTAGWIGRMIVKAGSGAWKVGQDVAASTLTKLLPSYLGLPS